MSDLDNNAATVPDKSQFTEQRILPERLPHPSVWPVTLSLGVTLLAFGVVTNWIMSVVGLALFLVAAGGWFMELRYDQLQ